MNSLVALVFLQILIQLTSSSPYSVVLVEEGQALCQINEDENGKPNYKNLLDCSAKIQRNNQVLSGIISQLMTQIDPAINDLENELENKAELTKLLEMMDEYIEFSVVNKMRLKYSMDWIVSRRDIFFSRFSREDDDILTSLNAIKKHFEEARNHIVDIVKDFKKVILLENQKSPLILPFIQDLKKNIESRDKEVTDRTDKAVNIIQQFVDKNETGN